MLVNNPELPTFLYIFFNFRNATTILKSDSIRALSLDGLCVIFASDDLIAEENVVYEAAKWYVELDLVLSKSGLSCNF